MKEIGIFIVGAIESLIPLAVAVAAPILKTRVFLHVIRQLTAGVLPSGFDSIPDKVADKAGTPTNISTPLRESWIGHAELRDSGILTLRCTVAAGIVHLRKRENAEAAR